MSTLLKPLQVRNELLHREIRIFTPRTFANIFRTKPHATKYFLENQTREEFLIRLKKGVYALKTDLPAEEEIANALYQPSYISFEYALAYHNILSEMTYTVTSATSKPTRLFTVNNTPYSYRTIKRRAFTGYRLIKKDNRSFLIAEPEKALVDYLYFVALEKAAANDRLHSTDSLDKGRLLSYAKLFGNVKILNLIKPYL